LGLAAKRAAPRTSLGTLAIGGIIFGWVFVLLAWWVDRHRTEQGARSS
jgi:uncharacterized membrane protein YsdA (DUF1294 family)